MICTISDIDKSDNEKFGFDTKSIDGPELKSFYHHFDQMYTSGVLSSNLSVFQIDMFKNAVLLATEAISAESDVKLNHVEKKVTLPISCDPVFVSQVSRTMQSVCDVDTPTHSNHDEYICEEKVVSIVREINAKLEPEKVNRLIHSKSIAESSNNAKNLKKIPQMKEKTEI